MISQTLLLYNGYNIDVINFEHPNISVGPKQVTLNTYLFVAFDNICLQSVVISFFLFDFLSSSTFELVLY